MDPTVGTFAGFIVEPIEVLTMDIHIPTEVMGDILDLTPTEAMVEATVEAMVDTEDMEDMEDMEATADYIVRTNFGPHRRHMRRVYRPA
jgi:hypothetical protein